MRNVKNAITDLVRKPPMLFPFIALFHVLFIFWIVWSDRNAPFPGIEWLELVWMTGYTLFWLAACDLRKWGAQGYIVMALLNTGLFLAARNRMISTSYVSNMFIIDLLFSFFLVYYYKIFH